MANIKKLKANGQDIVPITHEQAVLDSNGVTLESKLTTINNAISQLQNNSTSGTPSNPSLGGNTTIITMGNYIITYNETDDTLDFIYNGETGGGTGGDTPVDPTPDNYVTDGLSLYIDANDVSSYGSIRDMSGNNKPLTNHDVSTTLDNGCLNFVASSSNYIDTDLVPNLTTWSVELYFYSTNNTDSQTFCGWGASGNRVTIGYWNGISTEFIIAPHDDTNYGMGAFSNYLNTLSHVIITMNNGTLTSYVNGVKTTLATDISVLTSHQGTLKIGTKYSTSGEFGDMHLKLFRFYDGKVLTDNEATQNYNYEKNRN